MATPLLAELALCQGGGLLGAQCGDAHPASWSPAPLDPGRGAAGSPGLHGGGRVGRVLPSARGALWSPGLCPCPLAQSASAGSGLPLSMRVSAWWLSPFLTWASWGLLGPVAPLES